MDDPNAIQQIAVNLGGLGAVLAVVWWRMKAVEKQSEKNEGEIRTQSDKLEAKLDAVHEKLQSLNGPRIQRLEDEQLRTRERMHKLEGQGIDHNLASLLIQRMDELYEEKHKS